VYLRYAEHAQALFEAKERRKVATSRHRAARKAPTR
jgi:hypothetical protein